MVTTDPIDQLDGWLRGDFVRINTALEEVYFAGRIDVICGRPEHMRTSQLHGAVSHAGKNQIIGELECASWQCRRRRRLPFGFHVRVSP